MFLFLASACIATPDATPDGNDTSADTGHLGGGADMPAYCVEDRREAVADPTVAATDFSFAVQTAIDAQVGRFVGTLTPYTGESGGLTVQVADPGLGIAAVYRVLVDPNEGETGMAQGAPGASDCPPVYEYALAVAVRSDDGAFVADFSPTLEVSDPAATTLHDQVLLAAFAGTARPTFDIGKWASVSFAVDAAQADDAWTGSFTWFGLSEAAESAGAEAETGSVNPSGETEGVGGFEVYRTR